MTNYNPTPVREKHWHDRGYACMVVLTPMGHRCGYVGIHKGKLITGVAICFLTGSNATVALLTQKGTTLHGLRPRKIPSGGLDSIVLIVRIFRMWKPLKRHMGMIAKLQNEQHVWLSIRLMNLLRSERWIIAFRKSRRLSISWSEAQNMAKNFRISLGAAGPVPGMPHDAKGNVIYTAHQVAAINQEQHRRRITGHEMECMMGMVTAGNLILQTAPALYDHAAYIGKLPNLKRMVTQMRRLITKLNMAVEVRQMGAICGQMENAHITVSADYVPGWVNIRLDDLLHICNRAMEYCDMCCTCTREESKDCQLRKALELVPGVKEQGKEYARKDATRCPYRGMEMQIDGLEDVV